MKNLKNKMLNNLLKSSTAKMGAKFTGGNVLVAVIGAISTLVYGRWIGPEVLGEFNKYGILTGYLTFGIIFVELFLTASGVILCCVFLMISLFISLTVAHKIFPV